MQRGFSLVELLVAMVISLALVLAITGATTHFDRTRRELAASSDLSLNASFISYELERQVRSAGSGYVEGWRSFFGCELGAAKDGAALLPRASALPAPFEQLPQSYRAAPLLVHAGLGANGSDVLAILTGAAGLGEAPLLVRPGSILSAELKVPSTSGLAANDLFLIAEEGLGCSLRQVQSLGADGSLTLGGSYNADRINGLALSDFGQGGSAVLAPVGDTSGKLPQLRLLGLGDKATLFSHDMLQLDGPDRVLPLADGIVDLRARYGIDTNNDCRIDTWVAPSGNFSAAALSAGDLPAQQRLLSIRALRLGLVLRSERIEKTSVAPASLTLFSDLDAALQTTVELSTAQRAQRHQMLDFTIPLRNLILQAQTTCVPPT